MDRQTLVDGLNVLLELEMRGLPWRLSECQSYVDWREARVAATFQRIVSDGRDHERWLTEEIVALDGMPRPISPDMRSAGLHYVEARYLLRLLIEEKHRLVDAYQQAAGQFPTTSTAAGTVARILARHQVHLEGLEALAQQLAAAESGTAAPVSQGDDT